MKDISIQERKRRRSIQNQYLAQAKGILHLGAHLGQESSYYAQFEIPVLWVEAMPEIFKGLRKTLSKYENQDALCALLSNRDGLQKVLNISNNQNGVSSSVFEFGAHASGDKALWPQLELHMIDELFLCSVTLDTLLKGNSVNVESYDFWAVDLQGSELLALEGATSSLPHCNALIVEVSTEEVYRGGVLWDELNAFLIQNGFTAAWSPMMEHDDVIFYRES